MTPLELSAAYGAAEKIIFDAELETVNTHPVWQKLYRVKQYLRQRASEELAEVLA